MPAWWRRRSGARSEDGFILIESMIAITVITIVMTAVGAEFLGAMISTSQQRAQQVAVQIAGSAVDQIRALDASDLITGRGSTSVSDQFDAAIPAVQPWLVNMDQAPDLKADPTSGATAVVPTVGVPSTPALPTATDGRVAYTTDQYLGWCYIKKLNPPGTPPPGSTSCVTRASLGSDVATQYLRAVVAVTWNGPRCAGTAVPASTRRCSYVTSTLVSATVDRTFRLNAGAYPAPVVVAKPVQTVVVGDSVSLLMTVATGKGVPPFTWSDDDKLPPGLGPIDPSTGRITGTVGDSVGTFTSRVTVTDAFVRTDVADVTWRVLRRPTYTNPGSQNSTTADTVNRPILGAVGGEEPYTFSDPTTSLPPGLTVNTAGLIGGTPTTPGTYTVRIRLTDSGGRTHTDPFTWTVTYPKLAVTNPGTQTSPVSADLTPPLQLNATGGSGTYTWSDATTRTLPAGLMLNTGTGLITGTPTVVGSFTVTLTVTSGGFTSTVTFLWRVVESTPPANAITLSGVTGGAYKRGGTVFYRGSDAGSFTLTNAVTDASSGPASSQTAALGGTATGWTHTGSTVSTPVGGPYVSNPFAWGAGTSGAPTETVTGRDLAGNTAATPLTFQNDSSNPIFGSVSYPDGFTSGRSVTVTFAAGSDGESGIDPALGRLKRSAAPLVNGVCGTYTTINVFALAPTSPFVDTSVRPGACYTYQYVDTDHVGNKQFYTSNSVAKVDYAGTVRADPGLLSQWRFGEAPISSSDSFTDTTGTVLSSHTSQTGVTWTRRSGDSITSVISAPATLRQGAVGSVVYYTSAAPSTADYLVEADLVVKSLVARDFAGVVGRLDTAGTGTGTFYTARYDRDAGQWTLTRFVNGTQTPLGTYAQALTAGTYRVGLDMNGSTISVLVDGVAVITSSDAGITAAGRAGVRFFNDTTAPTDTTGLHLDNVDVSPPAVDSKGSNTGDYRRGVQLGVSGAIVGNTAATFDGANDSMRVPNPTGLPLGAGTRTVETWFKTSGPASGQGRQALFTYGTNADGQAFGVWLETDGLRIKAWGGSTGSDRVLSWTSNFNDNAWHHFVLTYDGTSTKLYLDGVLGSGGTTATRNTVAGSYGFGVGAVLDNAGLATSSYFSGSLDEMAFYTTALSQATITGHYQLGTSPVADYTGPTGGSVDASGLVGTGNRYSTSTTLSVVMAKGTDPSGLAASGAQLFRSAGTLSGGDCSAFGGFTQVGADDPSTPKTDTVADGACYRYQYVVSDSLDNSTTYTSGDIKVDTTAPTAPTLGFSTFTNAYATGGTVYYRPGATSGGFTVTASSTDASSGIGSYGFPALGSGWTSTAGSLGVNSYAWAAPNPTAPVSPGVTSTSMSGATSAATSLPVVADSTAPSAGTVSYADGSTAGSTVSVAFTTGTDGGSGLGTRLLQRASAPVTGTTCGTYSAYATVTNGTNPTSPVVDSIAVDTCYTYRYVVADNVGNTHTATSTNVAHTAFGAYYAFDAGTGSTAVDSTGNENTATLQAGASWVAPRRVSPYALNLNGTNNSWASTPNPVIDTSQSYSVTAWVRERNLNGYHTFVSIDGTSITPFFLQRRDNGRFAYTYAPADDSSVGQTVIQGPTPALNTWYHLAAVYDRAAGRIHFYVNGVSQGTAQVTPSWKALGSTNIGRGKYAGANVDFVDGAIDDVRFYDRAIPQAEVTTLAGQ